MINFIERSRKNNLLNVICYLFRLSGIKSTKSNVAKLVDEHNDNPSLLTVIDVLGKYGIRSIAVERGSRSLYHFETPFICSMQRSYWPQPGFTLVTDATESYVSYLDPIKGKPKVMPTSEFDMLDKGVVVLLDTKNYKDEPDFDSNNRKERIISAIERLPIYLVVFSLFSLSIKLILESSTDLWLQLAFTATSTVGMIISVFLIINEFDSKNKIVREVCGALTKSKDCQTVLTSRGSRFLNVSWTTWGGAYFFTFFITLILFPGSLQNLHFWTSLSLLATPYICYSIYYQWRIVKSWCSLCLSIQTILLINILLSATYLYNIKGHIIFPDWYSFFSLIFIGANMWLIIHFVTPLFKLASLSKTHETKWRQLHFHPVIFQYLLKKSNQISKPVDGLGILIGNPEAQNELIKVCNPYCSPCSKMHPEIEHIISNNKDFRVRIIFTASGEKDDQKNMPVLHFLTIQEKFGSDITQKALHNWYGSEQKNYEAFASKFPVEGNIFENIDKVKAMKEWCSLMKIRATPTFYINGSELPSGYNGRDLKKLLLDNTT